MSGIQRLERNTTQLLVVDIQEKLLPHIADRESVVEQTTRMLRAAAVLGLPVMVSEQYPRGLGHTRTSVLDAAGDAPRIEKLTFSVWRDPAARELLLSRDRDQVLLVGIEAHVCVQQTAFDLADAGLRPFVLADAVGSRDPYDRDMALERMSRAGIAVTTAEAAIFEVLDRCDTELFKRILPVVR